MDESALRKVIALDPDDEMPRASLAFLVARAGRLGEAVDLYEELIKINPNHVIAKYQSALCLIEIGRSIEGFAELAELIKHPQFEEILSYEPNGFQVYAMLTHRMLKEGRVVDADAIVQSAWILLDRSSSLHVQTLRARDVRARFIDLRASLHYVAAEVDIVAARTDRIRFESAINHLRNAFVTDPTFRTKRFPTNSLFDADRATILDRIDRSPR